MGVQGTVARWTACSRRPPRLGPAPARPLPWSGSRSPAWHGTVSFVFLRWARSAWVGSSPTSLCPIVAGGHRARATSNCS